MSARLLLNELAISSKIKEVFIYEGRKNFYLYFLNKMYRVLEDQEIIDSFIVPSVALQEPSSSQILTVGIDSTHSSCEFLVWGKSIDKVLAEYETGIKNILMKMSNSSESSSFQESIAITLDVLKSVNKQPRQLLVKVGDFT